MYCDSIDVMKCMYLADFILSVVMSSPVEVYGFVGWVTSLLGFVLYLSWALTPNEILESVGILYYPDKHWALTIPLLLSMAVVYVFTGYEFLNMMMVQTPEELSTVRDSTPIWTEEEVNSKFANNLQTVVLGLDYLD